MFRNVTSRFLKGLLALLPLFISIYITLWIFDKAEAITSRMLLVFWPDFLYVPGMGAIVGVLCIYFFGVLIENVAFQKVFTLIEGPFQIVPVVRTVYTAIKDFTQYFTPSDKKKDQQVVIVKMPDSPIEMVGLMTRENLSGMPEGFTKEGRVAVYFPMSYQLGGFTVFIPREWVKPTNMKVEVAIRSALTAWLPGSASKKE